MKKLLIILFLFWSAPLAVIAGMSENMPKDNGWALQFSIRDNFQLSSFQGTTISILKHSSVDRAWRMAFTGGVRYNNNKNNDQIDRTRRSRADLTRYDANFTIDLQKLFYANTESNINLFYGWGPVVGYHFNKSYDYSRGTREMMKADWEIGARLIFGVQWFPTNSISLHAEYGSKLSYLFSWKRTEQWRFDIFEPVELRIDDSQTNSLNLSSSAVKLGLSAYF